MKVLENVYNRYRDIIDQIRTALDYDDFEAARRLAHTFKGVAGTIGAKELSQRALDLESALNNTNKETRQIPKLTALLSYEVKRVMAALEILFRKEFSQSDEGRNNGKPEPPDMKQLKVLFGELSDLINEGNSEARDLIKEIKNSLGLSGISSHVRLLESQIDDYEFEDARETLNRVLRAWSLHG